MLPITRRISSYNHSSGNDIRYIVMHDTGNYSDTAAGNANYFNGGDRQSSAHYFVDTGTIYQVVEDSNAAWHCGDGGGAYGIGNHNSIGIEMCNSGGYISDTTIKNTLELVKYLMGKYNVPADRVVRHYDASRKICPNNMSANNWAKWYEFKSRLSGTKYTAPTTSTTTSGSGGSYYNVKEVQNMLIKIGYPCGSYGADGVWGDGTKTAVEAFQQDCNLKVDGWVGDNTYNKIKAEYNKKIGNIPKPSVPSNNPLQNKILYRVRLTWQDVKSQKGAYAILQNAIDECKKYNGYKVFDDKGNIVFPKTENKPIEVKQNKPVEVKQDKPVEEINKTSIVGKSVLTKEKMAQYVLKTNSKPKISVDINELIEIYLQEGTLENIRGDIAFCQAIKETGYFQFGGDMLPEQNNYCGLGATGGVKGAYFKTPRDGVKAQIQHLKAYASKESLKSTCVDTRFDLVEKGIAPNWEDLNGRWAVPGNNYGQEILQIYKKIELEEVKEKEVKNINEEKQNKKESLLIKVLNLLIKLLKKILK